MYSMFPMQWERQQLGLKGRVVTSVDEARVAQIDLDGSISYFPSPREDYIYTKCIDMNGLPVFKTYKLQHETHPVLSLEQRVAELEKYMTTRKEVDTNAEPISTSDKSAE